MALLKNTTCTWQNRNILIVVNAVICCIYCYGMSYCFL